MWSVVGKGPPTVRVNGLLVPRQTNSSAPERIMTLPAKAFQKSLGLRAVSGAVIVGKHDELNLLLGVICAGRKKSA
jgi:hypothetical protein